MSRNRQSSQSAPPVMDFVKGTPLSKLEERAKELLNDSHESTPCVQYQTLFVAMSEIGYTTIFRCIKEYVVGCIYFKLCCVCWFLHVALHGTPNHRI